MVDLTLRTVTRTQGSNAALKDGTVSPHGCAFAFEEVPVLVQAFRRMVRTLEFDVCEMALTTYLCAKAHGVAFTAVPVFLVRGFHHAAMVRHTEGAVRGPADLPGQRVGVNRGYTVTTGVWARGILQDEYGVDLETVTWLPSGDEHVAEYRPPRNVEPLPPGLSLEDAVAGGAVPAAVGLAFGAPTVAPLIDHAEEAAYTSLRDRRFYPINHTVVVRDEILDEHPDVAVSVFDAFAAAKRRYVDRLRAGDIGDPTATDRMYQRVMEVTGQDPLPYGIGPNREMLELLVRYAVDQHILAAPLDVPSAFAAPTRELVA
jgi:ABC-type nitrate/sulfonate/bicarbonate transport system substrate-binding protein